MIKWIDKKQTYLSSPCPHLLPEYRAFHGLSRGQSLRLERPWILELEGHLPRKMPASDSNLGKKQIFTVLTADILGRTVTILSLYPMTQNRCIGASSVLQATQDTTADIQIHLGCKDVLF